MKNKAYMSAIHQCCAAKLDPAANRDSPVSATRGVMVSGPMYRSTNPIRPLKPRNTWNSDDTMIAP